MTRPLARLTSLLSLAALLAAGTAATAQGPVAIKGGKIIPVVGEPIEEGTVLIRDGKIVAVGKDVEIPGEARVIDAKGKVVLPGFVNPHTSQAISQANEVNANVPYVSVIDGIDPSLDFFEDSRRNGVTSAAVLPGNNTMIGGQGLVVKTAGTFVNDMILKQDLGLKISLRPTQGRSRMSHLAALRAELEETKQFIEKKEKGEDAAKPDEEKKEEDPKPPGDDEPARPDGPQQDAPASASAGEEQRAALIRLIKGELPAFLYCDEPMDIPRALELADEYKLNYILVLSPSCYKAAPILGKTKPTVILDPTLVFWERDPRTDEDKQVILPKVYREAGIPITFQTAPDGTGVDAGGLGSAGRGRPSANLTLGTTFPWFQAATAVKYGMPPAEAIEALTLRPAKLLGVDKFVGSIEPGKDGDLVVWSSDPLKADAWVDTTLIDGKVVYERSADKKLADLLRPPSASPPKPAEGEKKP
jgi:hypothetical protein